MFILVSKYISDADKAWASAASIPGSVSCPMVMAKGPVPVSHKMSLASGFQETVPA